MMADKLSLAALMAANAFEKAKAKRRNIPYTLFAPTKSQLEDWKEVVLAVRANDHAQPEPASLWRDIESAPKDGTKFLLLYLGEPIIASWAHICSSQIRELVGHNVKWFDNKETVRTLKDGLGRTPDNLLWMPIPEPPAPRLKA